MTQARRAFQSHDRDKDQDGASCGDSHLPCPHLVLQVDLGGSLVELLLQAGHHGVVAGHAVDAHVLQPPVLHHLAARLHDQGHVLQGTGTGSGRARAVQSPRGSELVARPYLVVRGGLTILQPHAESAWGRFLVLLHDVDAPRGFLGAAFIWGGGKKTNTKGSLGISRKSSPTGIRWTQSTPGLLSWGVPGTFCDSCILPGGPGRAGSRLLQELGSDPQPTRALG